MKKLLKHISLIILISIVANITATVVSAADLIAADTDETEDKYRADPIPLPGNLPGIDPSLQVDAEGNLTTRNILTTRILPRFALSLIGFVGSIAILFLVVGGIRFATAYGKEESIESAKRQITWSIVGLLLAILSYTIVSIVVNIDFGDFKPSELPSPTADIPNPTGT